MAAQKVGLSGVLSFANPLMSLYGFLGGGKKDPLRGIRKQISKFKKPDIDTQKESTKKLVKHEPKGDGEVPKTIAEQITQGTGLAEGQKMLGLDDKRIQQIYQGRDLLKQTIEAGVYQGKQLTAEQIKILQNKQTELNKLIEAIEKAQAPVSLAYGGRVDKALGGRSRDI